MAKKKDPAAIARGHARAANLSSEQRAEIAKKAALARWAGREAPMKATHVGALAIGEIECAVLEDQRRVLSQRGVQRALGRTHGGPAFQRARAGDGLPLYVADSVLLPFVSEDLLLVLQKPVVYQNPKGGGLAFGLEASALPKVCEVWLKARDAGALTTKVQQRTAGKADVLMRALAHVGIIALVDEATGFQYDRARTALAKILEQFIRKELAAWAKVFPDDYYRQLFRLWELKYDEMSTKRPVLIGKLTKDIVYSRLAPGVLEELERVNPKVKDGYRRAKHFQWLTEDVGHPKLREHLIKVTTLMQVAPDRGEFKRMLNKALPKQDLPLLQWAAEQEAQEGGDDDS